MVNPIYQTPKQRVITALAVVGMIGSSTVGSFMTKAQYMQEIPTCDGCPKQSFDHPYMQTILMFIAEFCCIVIWLPQHFCAKKHGTIPPLKPGKKYYKFIPHVFLFIVPTLCDLVGSTLANLGVFYTLPSIVGMLGFTQVLFVATFSAICFRDYRQRFDLPQGVGLILVTSGTIIISLSSILFKSEDKAAKNNALGITMTLLGTVFSALFYITEEIFLRGVQMEASLAVTNEGAWGLLLHIILMPIYEHVRNPFWSPGPGQTEQDRPYMEDCKVWNYQASHSGTIIALTISNLLLTLIFNVTGCEVTNRISSAARVTFKAIKVVFTWVISIIIGWETWNNNAQPIKLVGFIVLMAGVFLYNNVTRWIPYLKAPNKEQYGSVGTQCKECCKKKQTARDEYIKQEETFADTTHKDKDLEKLEELQEDVR